MNTWWWLQVPPEIRALVRELPASTQPWAKRKRDLWLARLTRAVLAAYPPAEEGSDG